MDARRVRASGAGWFARHPLRLAGAILLGAIAVAAVIAIVVFAFLDAAGHVRTTADENLVAIGQTRARLVSDWRRERMYDASAVSHSPALRESVSHLVGTAPPDSHTYAGIRVAIAEDLALLQAEDAYLGSMLLDPTGKLSPRPRQSIPRSRRRRATSSARSSNSVVRPSPCPSPGPSAPP